MTPRGLIICILVTIAGMAQADAPPTLDELLNIVPPKAKTARPLPPPSRDGSSAPRDQEPMQAVIDQMRSVSDRLGRDRDPSIATQRLQQRILDRIDQMIKTAQESQGASQKPDSSAQGKKDKGSAANAQSSGKPGGTAENQGTASAGSPIEAADTTSPLHQNKAHWGNLPPRLRDDLLQGSAERFSPVYRALTESYYRRLAEENP